jgi:alcohol dehydrogenase YqhD (iron-dependent ADH family)
MLNFELYNPVRIIFGPGEAENIGKYTKEYGTKAMLVTYDVHDFFNELLAKLDKSFKDAGVTVTEFFKVKPNPRLSDIEEAIDICRKEGIEVIVALGGGSVMDSAKAIGAGVKYDGDPWKMFVSRHDKAVAVPPTDTLPTIMIPTKSATSSETNNVAVATNDRTHEKAYIWAPVLYPKICVMDPCVTATLPKFPMAAGAVDAMSHVLEAYLNGDQNSPVQDRCHEGLLMAVMDLIRKIFKDPDDIQARASLQWASTLTWNGYLQAGLAAPTPCHQIGHVLSALYDIDHGVTLAVIMPAFFRYTAHLNDERAARFAELGYRIFRLDREGRKDIDVADECIDKFVAFVKEVGVPVNLKSVNVPKEDLDKIADEVIAHGCDADGNLPSIPKIGRDGLMTILNMAYDFE